MISKVRLFQKRWKKKWKYWSSSNIKCCQCFDRFLIPFIIIIIIIWNNFNLKRKKIKHVSIIPEEINEKPMKFYDTICYKKKIERNCDFYGII